MEDISNKKTAAYMRLSEMKCCSTFFLRKDRQISLKDRRIGIYDFFTRFSVSFAIISSSLVGITKTLTLESGVEISTIFG